VVGVSDPLLVLGSLRLPRDIFSDKHLFVFTPTLQNYVNLWQRWPDFFHNLANSLLIALGATALTLVISFLAGYVYARRQGRMLTASAFFMILVRLLPPIVLTLPLFPAINWLMLNDTRTVLILLYCAFFLSLGTWIMKAFIDQLPIELEEAAAIDGSSPVADAVAHHPAAVACRPDRHLGVHHGVCLERLPVRLHLHRGGRQDRAGGDLGDGRRDRRCRLGHPVRGGDAATAADPGVRAAGSKVPDCRPVRRRLERIDPCHRPT
jgi:hypothetical protein